jgi:predicted DCC family thiol-disulfide oxidoreductase YuxK
MSSPAERNAAPPASRRRPPEADGPPRARPLVIYDGACAACCQAVEWLRRREPGALDFVPFQSPAALSSGIPLERLRQQLHLIAPGGATFTGAAAALRLLARDPRHARWLRWYEGDATFAEVSEAAYAFIARHRFLLSWLLPLAGRVQA